MSQAPGQGRSVWAYLGIGCLVVFAIGVLAMVGLGVMAWRWGTDLKASHRDPETRNERAMEVLRCDHLPEGYHAVAALTVPWFVDVAVLSDREPDTEGEIDGFDELGFIFLRSLRFGPKQEDLLDFFEGKSTRMDTGGWNVQFEEGEMVARGQIEIHGQPVHYAVQRGAFEVQDDAHDGIATLFMTECPGDERARLGIWFGPDPDPGTPFDQLDLTGAPGDEAALADFAATFDPCRP